MAKRITIDKVIFKNGPEERLPILDNGEPAVTDNGKLFVGSPVGNVRIGGDAITFETLSELQAAYPNGLNSPVWVRSENAWYYWSTTTPPADTVPPVVTASPAAGTYMSTQTVTLTTNETADIFYTLDGSTPTVNSTRYTGPISVSSTTTLRYIARDTAGNTSAPESVTYTINVTSGIWTISDNFNRADSDSVGTTQTGHAWSNYGTGQYGISNNQLYKSTSNGGNTQFVGINTDNANGTVEAEFSVIGSYPALIFRASDASNFLFLMRYDGAGYQLYKLQAGSFTQIGVTTHTTTTNGDVIRVTYEGTSINVYINGVLRISENETFNQSATIVGVQEFAGGSQAARWDNFKYSTQILAGTTQPS